MQGSYFFALCLLASFDGIGAGEVQVECKGVREKVFEDMAKLYGTVSTAVADTCTGKSEQDCEDTEVAGVNVCNYCAEDKSCWVKGSPSNTCHLDMINAAITAAKISKDVATGIADAANAVASSCAPHTENKTCLGGSLPNLCVWCQDTSKCHIMGSPQNVCLQNEMLDKAKDTLDEAARKAQEAASAELTKYNDKCKTHPNSTACNDAFSTDTCTWCEKYTTCYFLGDGGNKCVNEQIKEIVDTTTGLVKDVGEWAGTAYQDLEKWGSGICGGFEEQGPCDNDDKCTWCDQDAPNNKTGYCYVYSSVHNPCGNIQKGLNEVKKLWNNVLGKDECKCSEVQAAIKDNLEKAKEISIANLNVACESYSKNEFLGGKFMAAMKPQNDGHQRTAQDEALEDQMNIQVTEGAQSLADAQKALKEKKEQSEAYDEFIKANPDCSTCGAFGLAPQSMVLALALLKAAGFF